MAPAATSAGILLYRRKGDGFEVLLAHPGGPFWKNKDLGAWTIPKGRIEPGEEPFAAALREFGEETGFRPGGPATPLHPIRQRSGKQVMAWAIEGDFDPATLTSNTVPVEWPPRTGRVIDVPEVDRAEWFAPEAARERIHPAQAALIVQLSDLLNSGR